MMVIGKLEVLSIGSLVWLFFTISSPSMNSLYSSDKWSTYVPHCPIFLWAIIWMCMGCKWIPWLLISYECTFCWKWERMYIQSWSIYFMIYNHLLTTVMENNIIYLSSTNCYTILLFRLHYCKNCTCLAFNFFFLAIWLFPLYILLCKLNENLFVSYNYIVLMWIIKLVTISFYLSDFLGLYMGLLVESYAHRHI